LEELGGAHHYVTVGQQRRLVVGQPASSWLGCRRETIASVLDLASICEWGRDRETASPMPAPLNKPAARLTRHRCDPALTGDARGTGTDYHPVCQLLCAEAGQAGQRARQRVRGGLCRLSSCATTPCPARCGSRAGTGR
jgi:hypothetical protein